MKNFYLDENYRICRDPADEDYIYAICNDVNSLIEEFHKYDIDDIGIDGTDTNLVIYRWDIGDDRWTKLNSKETEKILSTFYSQYPEHCPNDVGGITRNTERKWNWRVKLENDTIQMNDEPVSLDEITSNFEIIQKPSFFGKRIKQVIIERA